MSKNSEKKKLAITTIALTIYCTKFHVFSDGCI